jgi:TonB family protein
MKSLHAWRALSIAILLPLLAAPASFAWGAKGHRMINRLAAEALPASMPAFMRTPQAIQELTYLGPEPDRWRSPAEPQLDAAQAPDHYIDLELADRLAPLPRERYQFIAKAYAYIAAHPSEARQMRPEHIGFQPYITEEVWQRLKSAMRDYRQLKAQHQNVRPVEDAILFYAGWLGHYVADGSQPLHTTIQYNGWVGPDPHGYTRGHHIHSQFETAFVDAAITPSQVRPLMTPLRPIGDEWTDYLAYLNKTHSYVDEVYQLYREHAFDGTGTPASRRFTAERLAAGASMLRNLYVAAWVKSAQPIPDWHHEAPKLASASTTESMRPIASTAPSSANAPRTEHDPHIGTVYFPGNGVTTPRLIYKPHPQYSKQARKAHYQGVCVLSVIVGSNGRPENIRVVRHLGMGLDAKAVEAVRQYQFAPAKYKGKPVPVRIHLEVNFRGY